MQVLSSPARHEKGAKKSHSFQDLSPIARRENRGSTVGEVFFTVFLRSVVKRDETPDATDPYRGRKCADIPDPK